MTNYERSGLPRLKDTSAKTVAYILNESCDLETIAGILDGLLCADANGALTDRQAVTAEKLFDELSALRPEAVTIAQERTNPFNRAGK
jgi:hypothetical protein